MKLVAQRTVLLWPTREQAAVAHTAMQALQAATLTHLDHEEAEIETFYLEHEDHPEIKAMGREFPRGGGRLQGERPGTCLRGDERRLGPGVPKGDRAGLEVTRTRAPASIGCPGG